jgi:hypothetical protein
VKHAFSLSFLVSILGVTASASAATPFLDAPIARATQFDATIANERVRHPVAFSRVASVIKSADSMDAQKRGRFAPMSPQLRAIGPDAGPALLEPLVHPERFAMPKEETAKIALRAGLIEAAGSLGMTDAAPLWRSILDGGAEYYEVRAAAEALGRVASESDVVKMVALVKTRGPKQEAVIAGAGTWRRIEVARAIGDVMSGDAKIGMASAHALGDLGGSWLKDANTSPMVAVRGEAARQAVRLYVLSNNEVRTAASDAVMTIDSSDTGSIISAARASATPDQNKALDALAARFAKNPVR